jgi:hypothetical protein
LGSIWIRDVHTVLRNAGLKVVECSGWQNRSRSSGGFETMSGMSVHHTAGAAGASAQSEVNYMLSASNPNSPTANLYLARNGDWWVMAAGATNTAGKGGPRGAIPLDDANRRSIGVEAGNNGQGEPWPSVQQQSYVKGVRALYNKYLKPRGVPISMVFAHFEWAPSRKIDPWGPSRWAGNAKWNMTAFRNDVMSGWPGGGVTPPPEEE